MDEKKRAMLMKIFRVVALILAVVMAVGIVVNSFLW